MTHADGDVARRPATSDLSADELDDRADRSELRNRYYGLLQELRVVVPGAQVLVAFLLTAPFSQRFVELDRTGRRAYLVALVASVLATVCFMTPTAYHRAGGRIRRSSRLQWAVRTTRSGLVLLAAGLTAALYCVTRLVFDDTTALIVGTGLLVVLAAMWLALPALTARRSDGS